MEMTLGVPTRLGKNSSRVARLRALVRREIPQYTVVDGIKLLVELATAGIKTHEIYASPGPMTELFCQGALAPTLSTAKLFEISEEVLQKVAPTRHSQGVLAVVSVVPRQIIVRGVVVYLDGVQDPANVGSVIRNAAAFGCTGVACSANTADPFSPRALRASAGHVLRMPVAHSMDFPTLAKAFTEAGGEVVATGENPSIPLHKWQPRRPALVAFGSEGQGLSGEIIQHANIKIRIPIALHVESLNIAVASGIILAHAGGLADTPILDTGRRGGSNDPPP